jgi:hypothetical protein
MQLVTSIPLSIHFYRVGYVSPATPLYCTVWNFIEFTMYVSSGFLLATISLQRHIIIFNANLFRIRWIRYVFHHLPLALSIIYPTVFYVYAVLLYPCDGTQWDYTNNFCNCADCYLLYDVTLGMFDVIFNNSLPVVIDILANVVLIIRVAIRKRLNQQQSRWRQQRRMVLQLFCLSSVYILAWLPSITLFVVQIIYPGALAEVQSDYLFDLVSLAELVVPWICIGFLPDLIKWIKQLFRCRQARNLVGTTQSRNIIGTVQTHNVVRTTQAPDLEAKV